MVPVTIPNCRAYDPAFAWELAVIVGHEARCMLEKEEDVFYYIIVLVHHSDPLR
jgi:pyruvate dehydrogenase E1 component